MARDLPSSYFYSSQPSSSQPNRDDDDEAIDIAFWQSTPTCLEELRQRTDDECHRAPVAVPDDRDAGQARARPAEEEDKDEGDPLCLSTQQSRLLRHTWLSSPAAGTAEPDPKVSMTTTTAQVCPPAADHAVSRLLENIEKACQTVDERIREMRIEKEWTNRMASEAARLGDEVGREDMDGERPRRNCLADVAQVADDPFGTHQSVDSEEVPTSQSQERYLSLSDLSQPTLTTGLPEPSFAPIDDDHVDVAITSVMSPSWSP